MVLLLELKVHWHVVTNSTHIDNDMLNLDQLYAIIMVSSERDVMLPVGFEMGIATLLLLPLMLLLLQLKVLQLNVH